MKKKKKKMTTEEEEEEEEEMMKKKKKTTEEEEEEVERVEATETPASRELAVSCESRQWEVYNISWCW